MEPPVDHPITAAPDRRRFTCHSCGQMHRVVPLAPGEKAWCVRCNTPLAKGSRFGVDTALACGVAGLILAVPAALLPFVTVSKLANERVGLLFTGVATLWEDGMQLLAIWVTACGALAPLLLLGTLTGLLLPARLGWQPFAPRTLTLSARAVEHWAMPEVQVLAVLVALVKLHTLVGVRIGPGFWCYVALSLVTLLGWRSFELDTAAPGMIDERRETPFLV
jgi:paraquat-inducible protein A